MFLKCKRVLTLTFIVQSVNEEELKKTSSWIFVAGLSTTDLQDTQWKFWLWKEDVYIKNN